MAFWGAPLDDPDHARHAVDAALAMHARLTQIHAELAARGWPALRLNIGINNGVVVGDMGSRHRRACMVLGDAGSLAAPLRAFSSRYGLGLVVGDATRAALGDAPCLPLGTLPARGRAAGLPAWAPLAPPPVGPADAGAPRQTLQQQPALARLCAWQRQALDGVSAQAAEAPD